MSVICASAVDFPDNAQALAVVPYQWRYAKNPMPSLAMFSPVSLQKASRRYISVMPDLYSHPFFPFIAGGTLVLLLVLASRVRAVRAMFSVALWGLMGFLLYSVMQTGAVFDPVVERLSGLAGRPAQSVVGEELRVPMAADGHFWVEVSINGTKRRMLVDSGATVTAVPVDTANTAGLNIASNPVPVLIRTANGTIAAQNTRAEELRLGNIVARDLGVIVSPAFGDTHVLGMNFLSRLKSWRVEGRTLILVPHYPQVAEKA